MRRARQWFVLDNVEVNSGEDPEAILFLALPHDREGQRVRILGMDPEPAEVIEDPLGGNRIAFWRRTDAKSGEQLRFTVDYEFEVSPVLTDVDPEAVTAYDKGSEEYRRYTVSEHWLTITPEIEAKAREVAGGEENPWRAARRIFDWVIANLTYEYPAMEDRGADKSFARKKGDCGEFSGVFIAMCRALGIPARSVICNWFDKSGHAWAEILVPPYGWVPVDTSAANMLATEAGGLGEDLSTPAFKRLSGLESEDPAWLFGNLYPNRIIVFVGNNLVVRTRDGLERTFLFLQPGGEGGHPCSLEVTGMGDRVAHCEFRLFDDEAGDEAAARARAEMELAGAYYAVSAYDKAEQALRRVVEKRPEDAVAWLQLGQIYETWNDLGQAEEAFRASIAGRAGSIFPVIEAWARIGLGNCHDAAGRREEALAEYRTVIESGVDFQGSTETAREYVEKPYRAE